jgi:hypothetical protein
VFGLARIFLVFKVVVGPDIKLKPGVKITLKKAENKDDFGMGKLSLADKGNDGTCNAGLITVNVVYNRFKISHRKNRTNILIFPALWRFYRCNRCHATPTRT